MAQFMILINISLTICYFPEGLLKMKKSIYQKDHKVQLKGHKKLIYKALNFVYFTPPSCPLWLNKSFNSYQNLQVRVKRQIWKC